MDYRDRNPNITSWSGECLAECFSLFPFNLPQMLSFFEYIAPDGVTRFLGLYGGGGESQDFTLSSLRYMIEAPEDCVMRKAFAVGDLSWEDYWHHKGWLLELFKPNIMENFAHARYVRPNDMSQDAKDIILKFNNISPLMMKYQTLCREADWERRIEKRTGPAQLQLRQFERDYGPYIDGKAA